MTIAPIRATILIVDDEPTFAQLLAEILKDRGYRLFKAGNVDEARQVMESETVDLLLMDFVMPGESALDFLTKRAGDKEEIPVIVVTGKPKMQVAIECFKHGAIDFLKKPVVPEKLIKCVQKALGDRSLVKDLDKTVVMKDNGRFIAGFKVLRVLGEGNMGVVHLVEGPSPTGEYRRFAMKMLKPLIGCEDERLELLKKRFLMEARAAFSLDHPNIVRVHDYGTCDENLPYLLMEYFEGEGLDRLLARRALKLDDKCRILRQVAAALTAIHDAEICHRDIKPGNIIVNSDMLAKLTDFGIARLPDSTLTKTCEIFGTPAYLSPEAFLSAKVDFRSDIFSLGAMAYEMFTDERPFDGPTIASIALQVRRHTPIWPRQQSPRFPLKLEQMLMKMLQKKPENRYDSAKQVCRVLDEYLAEAEGDSDSDAMPGEGGFSHFGSSG